ncbi:diaminopropionate ammonia-lyase [Arthrobacter sp. TB 26]|uniref:diaminopropionate ammonia-lyase n=1 Tax=Arthrobacter sp. TB 26 TaxID=494420 RepID=UPI0004253BC2|nr:diaminopropionate ammonia-lyase [Arthrobacter sp. TB 26]
MTMPRLVSNPLLNKAQTGTLVRESLGFHQSLPGYAPTPVRSLPGVARQLGVRSVHVKDESVRLGMPSFKILGASWATYRVLLRHLGLELKSSPSLHRLKEQLAEHPGLRLTAATDGNHGRAVARMAALLGLPAHIVVPADMVQARIDAIRSEGATVEVVDGGYDDAIARSAALASADTLVISDTSWEGYVDPPSWVIDGYSTMITEVLGQIERREMPRPTVVAAQIGVGAFAAAVVRGFSEFEGTLLLGVEPTEADCVITSAEQHRITTIPGPQRSIMAGLNCGTPSLIAWPDVSRGFDYFSTVTDADAADAMRALHADDVISGESGAAGLAGIMAHAAGLGLGPEDDVLVFSTEGATDLANFNRICGIELTSL